MTTPATPWYREPWTWLLIALPGSAVAASLASAVLAVRGADPVIEDDYYQRGLDINRTLERVHTAQAIGVHAVVEYDGLRPGESVWVRVRSTRGVKDATLLVRLLHPARSGGDRAVLLARVPGSPDTEAEFIGQWPDQAASPADPASAVNWRIALQGSDWQVEGDVQSRSDIVAR